MHVNYPVLLCLVLVQRAMHSRVEVAHYAGMIEDFSLAFNNKFVVLVTSASDTGDSVRYLVHLQKILNSSFRLFTSILDMQDLVRYFDDKDLHLQMTTMFFHAELPFQDLIPILERRNTALFTWLCDISSNRSTSVWSDVYLPFDSRFFVVDWLKNRAELYDVHQVSRTSVQSIRPFGRWETGNGLSIGDTDVIRRRSMSGVSLRVLLHHILGDGNLCSNRSITGHPLRIFECFNHLVWLDLENQFNFTTEYIIVSADDDTAEIPIMLEKLRNREAESSVLSLVLSSSRKKDNHFLFPVLHSGIYFITRVSYAEVNFASFLKPFSPTFWFALLAWLTTIGAALAVLSYAVDRISNGKKQTSPKEYLRIFAIPFQAMCSQSCALETESVATRMVLLMSYLVPVFCLTAYSGSLISFLTNPDSIPFQNLQQFERTATHKLTGIRESFFHEMLKTDALFSEIRRKSLVSSVMPIDYAQAFSDICTAKLTFVTELPAVTSSTPKCKTYTMNERLGIFFAAIPISPDFPFVEPMNRFLQKRIVTGIQAKSIQKATLDKYGLKFDSAANVRNPFPIQDIQSLRAPTVENLLLLFTILFSGVVLSASLLVLENIISQRKESDEGVDRTTAVPVMTSNPLPLLLMSLALADNAELDGNSLLTTLIDYVSAHHLIFLVSDNDGTPHKYLTAQKALSGGSKLMPSSVAAYSDLATIVSGARGSGIRPLMVVDADDARFNRTELVKVSREVDFSAMKWLLIAEHFRLTDYEDVSIPFNCLFIAAVGSDADGFALTEIYDLLDGSKVANRLGWWSPETGLEATEMGFYSRRRDLRGTVFNGSSNYDNPCSVHSFETVAGSVLKCLHHRLFVVLSAMNNFSVNWIPQNRSGGFDPTFLAPGIHFSLFEINLVTNENVSAMWPTLRTPMYVYTSYTGLAFEWSTFALPFSREMWAAIFAWLIASAVVTSTAEYAAGDRGGSRVCRCLYYAFQSYTAFCQQSEGPTPERQSLRILVFLIFLIPTALVPGYSAALTSFLAIKVQTMPFTDLEGLIKADGYKLGFHSTFNLSVFFDMSEKDPLTTALFTDVILPQDELPLYDRDGITRMCSERFSYMCTSFTIEGMPPPCPFFKLDTPLIVAFSFLPVAKGFPFKGLVEFSLRTIMYTAVGAVEARFILPPAMVFPTYDPPDDVYFQPIILENVITLIVGLGVGILLSAAVLAGEILSFKPDLTKRRVPHAKDTRLRRSLLYF